MHFSRFNEKNISQITAKIVYPIETNAVMTVYFYFAEIGNVLGLSVRIHDSARLHFTEIWQKLGVAQKEVITLWRRSTFFRGF